MNDFRRKIWEFPLYTLYYHLMHMVIQAFVLEQFIIIYYYVYLFGKKEGLSYGLLVWVTCRTRYESRVYFNLKGTLKFYDQNMKGDMPITSSTRAPPLKLLAGVKWKHMLFSFSSENDTFKVRRYYRKMVRIKPHSLNKRTSFVLYIISYAVSLIL